MESHWVKQERTAQINMKERNRTLILKNIRLRILIYDETETN